MEHLILQVILIIVISGFIISEILDWLNHSRWQNKLPESLKEFYNTNEYLKASDYHRDNFILSRFSGWLSFVIILVILILGGFGWLDSVLSEWVTDPVWLALLYFLVLFVASDLLNTPFNLYSTFHIEEKYGFNKTDLKTYFFDKIKGYLLTILIGGTLTGILLWLIIYIGPVFWIYGWILITLFGIFMNYFYTSLIVPLFNKLEPLEQGELREEIEKFAIENKFPVSNIYVIDGSKRSTKANAFFSGFGKNKRIVLFDTLIENHTTDEIIAILAHEIGHYQKKHLTKGMIFSILQTGFMLFLLSRLIFSESLSTALGAESLSIHVNLIAFGLLYGPVSTVIGLIMNVVSRKHEYEADAYAAQTTQSPEALMNALKKLSVKHLSNLHPHPAYVFMYYSHPPLLKRLEHLQQFSSDKVQTENQPE
jgi:STE24 endopeptidase